MKSIFLTSIITVLMLSSLSQAKVDDFNSIINEDIKAQKQLHKDLEKKVFTNQDLAGKSIEIQNRDPKSKKDIIVVESAESNYIAPSNKNFLKFNKEVNQKKTNTRKNDHRVAKEIKDLSL